MQIRHDNGTETRSKHDDSSAIFLNTCQASDSPPAARPAKSFALRVPIIQKQKVAQVPLWKCLYLCENCISKVLLPVWNFTLEASSNYIRRWSSPTCSLSPEAGGEMSEGVATGMTGGAAGTLVAADDQASTNKSKHPMVKSLHKISHQIPLVFNQLAIYRLYLIIWNNWRLKITTRLLQGTRDRSGSGRSPDLETETNSWSPLTFLLGSHWADNFTASIRHESDESVHGNGEWTFFHSFGDLFGSRQQVWPSDVKNLAQSSTVLKRGPPSTWPGLPRELAQSAEYVGSESCHFTSWFAKEKLQVYSTNDTPA